MHKYLLFSLLGMLLLVFTCSKVDNLNELELAERDAEYALPIFQTSTTIRDILEGLDDSTALEVSEEGLLTLRYKGRFTSRTSQDLFDVLSAFDNIPLPIQDTVSVFPFEVPNQMDIDFAILKQGTVRFGFQSFHDEPVQVEFRLPNLISPTGEAYSYRRSVPANPSTGTTIVSPLVDFSEYEIHPYNDSLFIEYDCIKPNGDKDTLSNFYLIISGFEASYIEGYLGNDIYELERDTIDIDFFDNWTRGDVFFDDPKLNITVSNSFGFPVRSKANLVEVFTVKGDKLPLRSTYINDGVDFEYPLLNEVGETKYTIFAFDRTNSNIDSILGAGPVAIDYDFDALPNPDGDTTIRGFLTDTSAFTVQVEAELPLAGKTNGFAVTDTVDVSLKFYEELKEAEFKLIADNSMPLDLTIQAFFVDADGIVLDSLFQGAAKLVEAAPVDNNGDVVEEKQTITFTTVDVVKYRRIQSAKSIHIRTSFSSYNNGTSTVRIRAQQGVEVRMGMKVKI